MLLLIVEKFDWQPILTPGEPPNQNFNAGWRGGSIARSELVVAGRGDLGDVVSPLGHSVHPLIRPLALRAVAR